MEGYEKNSYAVYEIKYHVIWVTKYRYKILKGALAVRTRELIGQGCEARGIGILQGSVGRNIFICCYRAHRAWRQVKLCNI